MNPYNTAQENQSFNNDTRRDTRSEYEANRRMAPMLAKALEEFNVEDLELVED